MGRNENPKTNSKWDKDTKVGCLALVIIAILVIGGIWFVVHKHSVKKAEAVKQEQIVKQKQQQKAQAKIEKEEKVKQTNSTVSQESKAKSVELKQLFKLSDIKNKSQDEVNAVIGQPTGSRKETWHYYDTKEEAPNCFTNIYQKNDMGIEVFFIDGKAARITVTPKNTIASGDIDNVLNMFYLTYDNPDFGNSFVTRWNNKFGVYEFSINFESDKVSFINIILDEKYR
ncbi:hypothetical protein [Clostridium tyrobutyricum]|uniref:hypothetical protein n=1 Tax=Clostridium tyrobutyricum TaxID=1519 RepID=UPI001C38A286|nr:hypothetical protein [Clostridium tyrobutyricum]MBV4423244.1 hypothetical protein [Clostridium tyrobutyricum]